MTAQPWGLWFNLHYLGISRGGGKARGLGPVETQPADLELGE